MGFMTSGIGQGAEKFMDNFLRARGARLDRQRQTELDAATKQRDEQLREIRDWQLGEQKRVEEGRQQLMEYLSSGGAVPAEGLLNVDPNAFLAAKKFEMGKSESEKQGKYRSDLLAETKRHHQALEKLEGSRVAKQKNQNETADQRKATNEALKTAVGLVSPEAGKLLDDIEDLSKADPKVVLGVTQLILKKTRDEAVTPEKAMEEWRKLAAVRANTEATAVQSQMYNPKAVQNIQPILRMLDQELVRLQNMWVPKVTGLMGEAGGAMAPSGPGGAPIGPGIEAPAGNPRDPLGLGL